MSCLSKANLQITVGVGVPACSGHRFKNLHILRSQYANFPTAESAWRKQWGTKGEQEEVRDTGFSCDQWGCENRLFLYGYWGGRFWARGSVAEGGACKYLVKFLYFVANFCPFAERIQVFPRDF